MRELNLPTSNILQSFTYIELNNPTILASTRDTQQTYISNPFLLERKSNLEMYNGVIRLTQGCYRDLHLPTSYCLSVLTSQIRLVTKLSTVTLVRTCYTNYSRNCVALSYSCVW